jgi:hypothetical protein
MVARGVACRYTRKLISREATQGHEPPTREFSVDRFRDLTWPEITQEHVTRQICDPVDALEIAEQTEV